MKEQAPQRRVCITGLGAVSPLGHDRESTWQAVLAGRSAAGPITQFPADTWPTRIACEVKDFSLPPAATMPGHRKFINRPLEFGLAAAWEAMRDSGLDEGVSRPERFGVAMGAGLGALSPQALARMVHDSATPPVVDKLQALLAQDDQFFVLKNHPGMLAALLSARWQALGPVSTIHSACASSGQSIGQAYVSLQRGEADIMLAGGADSLAGELLLAGFCLLGALSQRNDNPRAAARPFDKDRDGFVAGEGAAMLVLEEREHALRRGARIYGEIRGYGETQSAFRVTDLHPEGRGIVEAMQEALATAAMLPQSVGYINAHGTSTAQNDEIESRAIRRVFYDVGAQPLVSSTKAAVGHLISAAGAMEALFTLLALRDGQAPPNLNLEDTDCDRSLRYVVPAAQAFQSTAALSNSVGFGGSNACVLLTRGLCD